MLSDAGEFTVLVGPNGAGTSTLIRTIAALQPAIAGRVLLDGKDIHLLPAQLRAQQLAVVLTQQIRTWSLTAWQDLELALKIADRLWVIRPGGTFVAGTATELSNAGVFDDVFPSEQLLFDREQQRLRIPESLQ